MRNINKKKKPKTKEEGLEDKIKSGRVKKENFLYFFKKIKFSKKTCCD